MGKHAMKRTVRTKKAEDESPTAHSQFVLTPGWNVHVPIR
jgi:hypothetical protein